MSCQSVFPSKSLVPNVNGKLSLDKAELAQRATTTNGVLHSKQANDENSWNVLRRKEQASFSQLSQSTLIESNQKLYPRSNRVPVQRKYFTLLPIFYFFY